MQEVEAETILQPSLHNLLKDDWYDLLLSECESRNIPVADLRITLDNIPEDEDEGQRLSELGGEVEERLWKAGYSVYDEDDTFLIYPKGVVIPGSESDFNKP